MDYTDFIAVIDLGTSKLVGMVGKKSHGKLSILAIEDEGPASCIRRGCVYNVEETAAKIKRLIQKLENKLRGGKIAKVYVGINGQSIRTMEHSVSKVLGPDETVTEEVIRSLYHDCMNFKPEMHDLLDAVSPMYYLDDKPEMNPVGVICNKIEARYKLIVGRPNLKRNIIMSLAEKAKIEIAGFIVTPLAQAEATLTEDEKRLGCALINFGAGVTTLAVYKGGLLQTISVIPLGAQLITKDITSLNISESEAERLKIRFGSAISDKDSSEIVKASSIDGFSIQDIYLSELNTIVEARAAEIFENVWAQIETTGLVNKLGAGIVISGGGANLNNLNVMIKNRTSMDVRLVATRKGLVENAESISQNPSFSQTLGLLMMGNESCAKIVKLEPVAEPPIEKEVKPITVVTPPKIDVQEEPKEEPIAEPKKETVKEESKFERESEYVAPKKKGFARLFDNFAKTLFEDQEESIK
ncbi:MAG TPA: cell division protein FtsA [Porphyromonadaceae bacterium]|nr:cell division protein FtsA [Porphyromonadaceae bacterium]